MIRRCDILDGMSQVTETPPMPNDPKELRPLLHEQVDQLPDEYLQAARALLLEMQLQQVTDDLDDAADAARAAGKLTPDRVAAAIAEHRAAHPCRR